MRRRLTKIWLTLALVILPGTCLQVFAASLQVAPTLVELKPSEKGTAVWLSNTDPDTPVRAQVRLFRWVQQDGEERLEPTTELAISPPLVELSGGARQLVRVIRTGAPPTGFETSYRIIVDEVPTGESAEGTGLKFLLRYSIPVFVLPVGQTPITYDLTPRLERTGDTATLVVGNRGNRHAQLADLVYIDSSGKRQELIAGLVGYVLPGQTMSWALPVSASRYNDSGNFKVRINGEAVEQTLTLGHPAP